MKSTIRFIIATFIMLIVNTQATLAADLNNMYAIQTIVKNRSETARNTAMAEAFKKVLIKVSGNSQTLQNDVVKSKLKSAQDYIDQFRYFDLKKTASDGQISKQLAMQIQFDPITVDELLTQSGLTVWGRARPLTLVWLAMQTSDGRKIISANDHDQVIDDLKDDMQQRGIPMLLPDMDLQDLNAISVKDIWDFNLAAIKKASLRYGAQAILVATVNINDQNEWQSNWHMLLDQAVSNWDVKNTQLDTMLNSSIAHFADNLALQIVTTQPMHDDWVTLTVTNINSFDDLEKLKNYLANLDSIKEVETQSVGSDYVILKLVLIGDPNQLQKSINVNEHLQKVQLEQQPQEQVAQANPDNQLQQQTNTTTKLLYKWIG